MYKHLSKVINLFDYITVHQQKFSMYFKIDERKFPILFSKKKKWNKSSKLENSQSMLIESMTLFYTDIHVHKPKLNKFKNQQNDEAMNLKVTLKSSKKC